ncbi:MAG TPA: glycosyltransferase family 39 protein [Candidatus Limnocylindrales bacterium]|nr:glycosyltransferase family 39 protein [Candidatus Limnocylindrales bacterium]
MRLWTIAQVPWWPTEGSAYYVGVARNLVEGRGLVTDALWSYATGPLGAPRPAFELWMPMASLLAAPGMLLWGPSLSAAQLTFAVLGALLAPLAWFVARDAAQRISLPSRRASMVALSAGVFAALLAPFLLATAGPDSTLPFALFGSLACVLMPGALRDRRRGALLGLVLGLAYLSRQEGALLGIGYLILAAADGRGDPVGSRAAGFARRLMPAIAAGALVTAPWLLRNALVFGSPFSGQAVENLFFVANSDVFAYLERPTLERFLAQGPARLLGNIAEAFRHDLVNVLLLPTLPVGLLGLATLPFMARRRALPLGTPLGALTLAGGLIFGVIGLLFPVATLWGTFLHSAGPALLALVVLAALGLDAATARIRAARAWSRDNAWLGPLAALVIALPLVGLQVGLTADAARGNAARFALLSALVTDHLPPASSDRPTAPRADVISDRPIWLAETLRRPVAALPDEPPAAILRLTRSLTAPVVLIVDGPSRLSSDASGCFVPMPVPLPGIELYELSARCSP